MSICAFSTNDLKCVCVCVFVFKDLFIYLREKEHVQVVGGGRREKENLKQTPVSMEPETGLDFTTLRSWLELKSRVISLTDQASQAPLT